MGRGPSRALRQLLGALLMAGARGTGQLRRAMAWYWFRRLVGPHRRRAAWRSLGASIGDTAIIGPRVTMRNPAHVSVGEGSRLGGRVWIDSWGEVTIGANVLMNGDIDLFSTQHLLDDPNFKGERRSVQIGDYVWLPWKVIVLPGVSIGDYAVIGSGSVVAEDIPAYAVAAGNPARVLKERARIAYSYVPSSLHLQQND